MLLDYREELAEPCIKVLLVGLFARELEKERVQWARNVPPRNLATQIILLDLRAASEGIMDENSPYG